MHQGKGKVKSGQKGFSIITLSPAEGKLWLGPVVALMQMFAGATVVKCMLKVTIETCKQGLEGIEK